MAAHDDILAALLTARRTGQRVSHGGLDDAALTPDAAYALQHRQGAALGWWADAVPRAWKSGGGTLAGITHAPLPDAGVVQAGEDTAVDGTAWPPSLQLHQRGIEAEIALRLGHDVTPADATALTRDGAAERIDALCVSLEVVDTRWAEGWVTTPALLRLADLQSHGALALGAWQPVTPATRQRDWGTQRGWVTIGGAPRRDFTGTHPLGDPFAVLPAWLRHLTRDGATVPAGTVVTTGSWCGLPLAEAGERVEIGFEGLGEVVVRV
jgi:2-keto-4-pentenoate hydratase